MKMKRQKYQISGNLSEKQIESDVSLFMGWCTPRSAERPFQLFDINEPETGADKKFTHGMAIYIQFKKSKGLKSILEVPASTRKNRSKLEDIRIFRHSNELEDSPTLYFKLHRKTDPGSDFQHNVLRAYERPPISRAVYIAPLALDKDEYNRSLFDPQFRELLYPFYHGIPFKIHEHNAKHMYTFVPFLHEHIAIAPHVAVDTAEHYYAYSSTATDVSWHSPTVHRMDPYRLSSFLNETVGESIRNTDGLTSTENLATHVCGVGGEFGYTDDRRDESPVSRLLRHGRWLHTRHGIRQFIVLAANRG